MYDRLFRPPQLQTPPFALFRTLCLFRAHEAKEIALLSYRRLNLKWIERMFAFATPEIHHFCRETVNAQTRSFKVYFYNVY